MENRGAKDAKQAGVKKQRLRKIQSIHQFLLTNLIRGDLPLMTTRSLTLTAQCNGVVVSERRSSGNSGRKSLIRQIISPPASAAMFSSSSSKTVAGRSCKASTAGAFTKTSIEEEGGGEMRDRKKGGWRKSNWSHSNDQVKGKKTGLLTGSERTEERERDTLA